MKVTANGKVVKKTERVPVNARIVVEVYDGRLGELRDSLQNEEYLRIATEENIDDYDAGDSFNYEEIEADPSTESHETPARDEQPEEEEPSFIE